MKTSNELKALLRSIDHRSYPAYKSVKGSYRFASYILNIDHVQGDPFASPSKVSFLLDGKSAGFPNTLYDKPWKRIALQDQLIRIFSRKMDQYNFKAKGSGKSGLLSVSRCGQEILERTACTVNPENGDILIRIEVGFPANGRTINASELLKIFFDFLPECVVDSLTYRKLSAMKLKETADLADDQEYIRGELPKLGLAAFVANGSVLPRESGVSSRPMKGSIPFVSPKSLEVELELPHYGRISGMGLRKGITLIVGGGYHGKSTLLKALELGVYNHIAGDGREYVISDSTAVKIRAEDGRSVKKADISLFVNNLPSNRNTKAFYTEDASGSTSQAANVIEAMESGSSLLLIDEDTSATNFMVRDELMQRVVHRNQEPITPFIERAGLLFQDYGISSILVAGSSGSYFHIADTILQMDYYKALEITEFAKQEAKNFPAVAIPEEKPDPPSFERMPLCNTEIRNDNRLKIKVMGRDSFALNRECIDLRLVEQLVDAEQTAALGYMLAYAEHHILNGRFTIQAVAEQLLQQVDRKGLASVCKGDYLQAGLARPRKQEIIACLNRYRKLKLEMQRT